MASRCFPPLSNESLQRVKNQIWTTTKFPSEPNLLANWTLPAAPRRGRAPIHLRNPQRTCTWKTNDAPSYNLSVRASLPLRQITPTSQSPS